MKFWFKARVSREPRTKSTRVTRASPGNFKPTSHGGLATNSATVDALKGKAEISQTKILTEQSQTAPDSSARPSTNTRPNTARPALSSVFFVNPSLGWILGDAGVLTW